jgi:hypothetical protein
VPLSSAGGLLPGAKLHFFQTGTSTPQNTYQDVALTTAHANPVVADAEGVFAPIYLDGSLPDYRVRLTTSADVQLWQLDGIPSSQDESQTYRLEGTAPAVTFEETDASSGNKIWHLGASGEEFSLRLSNDAESVFADVMRFKRSGTTLTEVTFGGLQPILGRFATKNGSNTRNTTTTLADDDDLALSLSGPLTAQAAYAIEGVLYFNGATIGTQGIKLGFNYSGTLTDQNDATIVSYVNGTGAISRNAMTASSPLTFATIGTTSRGDWVRFSKVVSPSTLGTYTLQWAQNSSNADNISLHIFSWIRAQRVLGG